MKTKKLNAVVLSALMLALTGVPASGQSGGGKATVKDLGFKYDKTGSRLEISFDGDVAFEKSVSEADKQVVIDVKNATIAPKWARRIDTSQHRSNVSLISPYQSGDGVRVVLQLKENGGVEVSQDGSKLVAVIDNKQSGDGGATQASAPEASESSASSSSEGSETAAHASNIGADAAQATADAGVTNAIATGDSPVTIDAFMDAQKSKSYVGKKIYLQLKDAELQDVFRVIGEASEFNIILTDAVKGRITVNLMDVPWDQALDLVLTNNKLAAERHGNVLRITTVEAMTKEKEIELAARKTTEAAEPLVVKIFPISYAKIEDLVKIITDFLSPVENVGGGTVSVSPNGAPAPIQRRGSIQIESRTNSLIVRDTPSNIEKIKRVIQELDMQTPQVLIEAKFVEVSENQTKQIQGRIFATSREFAGNAFSFNNSKNNFGSLFGGTGFTTLNNGFAISPVAGGASFGFQPKAALLPGIGEIGALLSILETESQAKIIASPRIVTQNKQAASITQGQSIQLATAPGANGSGGFTTIDANLSLSVTPQVTNDGGILMQVSFSQSTPAASSVAGGALTTNTKSVSTNVFVDSGATIVIGGIYVSTVNESAEGLPILRELPLIGPLFGSKGRVTSKGELFIFLTPRVINDKESGIRG